MVPCVGGDDPGHTESSVDMIISKAKLIRSVLRRPST